ncbi:MAG: hypothetical protein ACK4MV_05540 [Beijerinckiaceae bacterium]
MKTYLIAMAAAASLAGATLISAEASAAPYGGPGGFKPGPMKPGGGFKPGPGAIKPGAMKPGGGFKPGPGGLAVGPGKPGKGGGAWKPPHKGHGHGYGHWKGNRWGYAAAGFAGAATVAYFASPVYTSAYYGCDWVRVPTEYGWRWRPYC